MENQLEGNPVKETAGPSDDFFTSMEQQVNGVVFDNTAEEKTQNEPNQATQSEESIKVGATNWESDDNPYKKRYGDSTKEAQQMIGELKSLKPFIPILEAMKKDNGLVDHVKGYLVNGGAPSKTITEELGVSENFEYDGKEALDNPESDSAKVLNAHVDAIVNKKLQQMMQYQNETAKKMSAAEERKIQEKEFKRKHNMSDEDFTALVNKAKGHTMTLDDLYLIMNKDQTNKNIADATKTDVLNQMKNVREVPQSVAAVNSMGTANKSDDDKIFESILGSDASLDELFG